MRERSSHWNGQQSPFSWLGKGSFKEVWEKQKEKKTNKTCIQYSNLQWNKKCQSGCYFREINFWLSGKATRKSHRSVRP